MVPRIIQTSSAWLFSAMLLASACGEDSTTGTSSGTGATAATAGSGGIRPSGGDSGTSSTAGGDGGQTGKGGSAPIAGSSQGGGAGEDGGDSGAAGALGGAAGSAGTDSGAGAGGDAEAGAGGEGGQADDCVIATDGVFDWDVRTVPLTGTLTVNGAASPLGSAATFWLVDPETGDEALLGEANAATYSASVVPKTYDLYYRFTATTLPTTPAAARHTSRRVRRGIAITTSTTLDADLQTVTVTGRVTIDGQVSASSGGTIWLESTTTSDEVLLHRFDGTGVYEAWVAPGTYQVFYRATPGHTLGTGPIANTNARLLNGVVVSADRTLDIDIPTISLSGRLTVNGAQNSAGGGSVVLRREEEDMAVLGGAGSGFSYSVRIVPGSYETYFSAATTNPSGRVNQNARLAGYRSLGASQSDFHIDVPVLRASSEVTLNGAVVPATNSGTNVVLKRVGTGFLGPRDEAVVGYVHDVAFPAAVYVVPGVYDVHLVNLRAGGVSGIMGSVLNRDVRVAEALDLGTNADVNLDVPIVDLSGTTTTPPSSSGGYITLYSRSQPGDFADLTVAGSGAYAAGVAPGRYDVVYEHRLVYDWQPDVPQTRNTHRVIRRDVDFTTSGPASLDVDVQSRALSGAVTLNGSLLPSAYGGRLVLRSLDGTDSAYLAAVTSSSYDARVFPGTYDVYFTNTSPTTTTGHVRNRNARLGCMIVPEAD